MKKIFRFMMAAVAAAVAMTSCQQENIEPDVQEQEGVTVRIVASLSDETKASLVDGDYLKWDVNDEVLARGYNSTGDLIQIDGGKVLSVDEESNTAVYEFTGVPAGSKLWLGHNANGPTARKFEFNKFISVIQQDEAGRINKGNLMLVSEMVTVPAEVENTVELSAKMRIVGSLLRFLVYSSSGVEESVESIKLEVVGKNISATGGFGCLAYYFYQDGTYKYWADNNNENPALSEDGCLFYPGNLVNYVTTVMGQSVSLSGVKEPTIGTGVYMPVCPVKASGYIYTVTTDAAVYTFDASTVECQFTDNQLKNVLLNLDKGKRVGHDEYKGELRYVGSIDNISEIEVVASGAVNQEYVHGYAQTKDENADWVPREGLSNIAFYEDVVFEVIDDQTGETATWITVKYGGLENSRWVFNVEANEGSERTATVTARFSDVNGYILIDGESTKQVKVIQASADADIEYGWGAVGNADLTFDAEGAVDMYIAQSYYCLAIGGQNIESWADDKNNEQALYSTLTMTPYVPNTDIPGGEVATWVKVGYGKDNNGKINGTHPYVTIEPNMSTAERKATVYINVTNPVPEGYVWVGEYRQFQITQKGRQLDIEAVLSKTYDQTVPASGGDITFGTLAIDIDGVAAVDVAAAMTQYGVTAVANNGATVSVAADGTVSMNIPANPYKNGGKEYTITIKHDGNTLAAAAVSQAEGEEETEEVLTCPYTYDIEPVGGWDRGFGFAPNKQDAGNWGFIRNVKLDGVLVTLTEEIANEVMSFAFRSTAPTQEEIEQYSMTSKTPSADAVKFYVRWFGGVQIDASIITGESGQITKVTGYNSDGSVAGYYMIWTD